VIGLYYERRCRLSRQGRILSPGLPHPKSDDSSSYPTTQVRRHFATWQSNPHWPPEVCPADSTLAHPRVESYTTRFCSTYTRRTRAHLHPRIDGARWIPRSLDLAQENKYSCDLVAVLDAHARALRVETGRVGFDEDEVLGCCWGPHPRIKCAAAVTSAADQAVEVRVSDAQLRCGLMKC